MYNISLSQICYDQHVAVETLYVVVYALKCMRCVRKYVSMPSLEHIYIESLSMFYKCYQLYIWKLCNPSLRVCRGEALEVSADKELRCCSSVTEFNRPFCDASEACIYLNAPERSNGKSMLQVCPLSQSKPNSYSTSDSANTDLRCVSGKLSDLSHDQIGLITDMSLSLDCEKTEATRVVAAAGLEAAATAAKAAHIQNPPDTDEFAAIARLKEDLAQAIAELGSAAAATKISAAKTGAKIEEMRAELRLIVAGTEEMRRDVAEVRGVIRMLMTDQSMRDQQKG